MTTLSTHCTQYMDDQQSLSIMNQKGLFKAKKVIRK